jgi:hypothetical protein
MERLGGGHSASTVSAGGLVYFVSDKGVTTVVRPGVKFDVISKNELGERCSSALERYTSAGTRTSSPSGQPENDPALDKTRELDMLT